MKDLKQIQEFFSKSLEEMMSLDDQAKAYFLAKVKQGEIDTLPENPKAAFLAQMTKDQMDHDRETLRRERGLEEGKQLDIEDFAKVVKAVHQTGHPVTVLLVPKFNEIEVITGMNAPDDMLRDLSNAVDALGYGRNDIFIAGDSSNLSRREYSDIRRVNGGAKDYFQEASKEEENEFHKKLDKLVHKTFGHSSDEKKKMEENALGMTDSRLSSDQHVELDYAVRGDSAYTFGNDPYADDQLRYKYAKKMGFLQESSSSEERRIAKRAIRSIAKYRGVSEDEARNDLIRAAKELGSLKEAVKDMFETIKLGKQLNEELCDKGKRYIKARQAAGEKSSAYLSGRAVRVCKGQIEWPKKGKKK